MPHVWIKSHSRLRMIPFIDHLYLVMFYRPGFVGHWRHRHILPSLVEGDELKTCWTALVGLQQGSVLEENPLRGLGQQQSTTAVWKRRENIEMVMFSFQVLWVSQYDISSSKFSDRWKYKYPAGKGNQNSSCLSKENGLICKAKDPFYRKLFFPVSNDSLSKYLLNIMGNIAILRWCFLIRIYGATLKVVTSHERQS